MGLIVERRGEDTIGELDDSTVEFLCSEQIKNIINRTLVTFGIRRSNICDIRVIGVNGVKEYLKKYRLKTPKICQIHKLTDLRNYANPKQDKPRELHNYTFENRP